MVLGAEVAKALHYQLGDRIVLAHGVSKISLTQHDDKPFTVVGILERTGTPVDRTLHISLQGMEALHVDWKNGAPAHGDGRISAEQVRSMDLQPRAITAFLLGLKSKVATFALQRQINEYEGEPLLAILPGVALQELWSLMGTAEKALFVVSLFVVLTGLIGMLTAILTSLNERRREMAILRSVGARPWHIFSLLVAEAFALALAGVALGLGLLYLGIALSRDYIQGSYGIDLPLAAPTTYEWSLLAGILVAGLLMGCVPAWRAYRQSLADGLSIRL
ncbi:macrolide transporter ATP-binding /permease protein [compost metagenome]